MRRVGFCGSLNDAKVIDLLPSNKGRASLVQKMIQAYGLHLKCIPITIQKASREDLEKFHDPEFVKLLLRRRRSSEDAVRLETMEVTNEGSIEIVQQDEKDEDHQDGEEQIGNIETLERFGLLYDCPVFSLLDEYVKVTAGSTLTAARFLISETFDNPICINWNGGRHHAKKSKASGFCYVNDIVLAISELRKKFDKVMYIDLDLHHGDGVETAFKFSDKVTTFSIHRKDLGFFPGTGSLNDRGKGKGFNHCFNVPIKHGLSDESMDKIVDEILIPLVQKINPDCLCVQCGCDGLNSDEHQEWNLTIKGFGDQVSKLLDLKKPTLLLGGGGYNNEQVARCWTYLTKIALGLNMEFDLLPDDEEFDHYEFWNFPSKNMIDENDSIYIDSLKTTLLNKSIT